MKALIPPICIALSACAAPAWVNPQNPGADLQADTAACERDAERLARLGQLAGPSAGRVCADGPACVGLAESQRIQLAAEALGARKRCLAARGWRES